MTEPPQSPDPTDGATARDLLVQIAPATNGVVMALDDDVSLVEAGVDSAQLVELSLVLEDLAGRPLDADELDRLTTLRAIDAFIDQARTASTS